MNAWYVLAKEDKRYKYDFYPIFHRSHVFKNYYDAVKQKNKLQNKYKSKLVILKRTCEVLK